MMNPFMHCRSSGVVPFSSPSSSFSSPSSPRVTNPGEIDPHLFAMHGSDNERETASARRTTDDHDDTLATDTHISEVPKPKRPRTAYNLFFRDQQEKMTAQETKIGRKKSPSMATMISNAWKQITPSVRLYYDQLAAEDKFRYMNERIEYRTYLEQIKGNSKNNNNRNHGNHGNNDKKKKPQVKLPRYKSSVSSRVTPTLAMPEEVLFLPPRIASHTPLNEPLDSTRPCSSHEIAMLASKLDPESIAFLIQALR